MELKLSRSTLWTTVFCHSISIAVCGADRELYRGPQPCLHSTLFCSWQAATANPMLSYHHAKFHLCKLDTLLRLLHSFLSNLLLFSLELTSCHFNKISLTFFLHHQWGHFNTVQRLNINCLSRRAVLQAFLFLTKLCTKTFSESLEKVDPALWIQLSSVGASVYSIFTGFYIGKIY